MISDEQIKEFEELERKVKTYMRGSSELGEAERRLSICRSHIPILLIERLRASENALRGLAHRAEMRGNTAEELSKALVLAHDNLLKAESALVGLRYEGGCFCEVSIGNPMMKTHTSACEAATKYFERR